MEIKTRRQAAELGESKYYTGRPCANGHDGPRYTSNGICCKCNSAGVNRYNTNVRLLKNNKKAGAFVYNLHPDDHATLLACAQALDLQRGRIPQTLSLPQQPSGGFVLPADHARFRGSIRQRSDGVTLADDEENQRAVKEHNASCAARVL